MAEIEFPVTYMNSLLSNTISGTWATVLLPINGDETINYDHLESCVRTICASGVRGVYTNGTAGEFLSQSEDEFDRINSIVAGEATRAGLPFQIGACHSSPQVTLERVRRAKPLEPVAFQVILPDWCKLGNEEAVAFLSRIAEAASPIPLILYNPPHAKRVLDLADIANLRTAVPSLVGVKIGDGSASWYAAMRRALPEFSVFVPGHHYASGRLRGAHGTYSNLACLNPSVASRWDDIIADDIPAALALERRILDFFSAHLNPLAAQGLSGAALDKLLCTLGGWCEVGPRLRWPYRFADRATVDRLQPIIRAALPEFFPCG
jgi:dihydrodipicolinate synthase/N-acetylneuraminate lyase